MRIIGGKNYRWRGEKIRAIKYEGAMCATMPRKESVILASANIDGDSFYRVTINAKNKGGNGKAIIGFDDKVYEGIYIVSSDFKKHSICLCTDSLYAIDKIRISRPPNASGSIVVKEIIYEKTERPKEEAEVNEPKPRIEKNIQRQIVLGRLSVEKYKQHKEKQNKRIISERGGDAVGDHAIIGGSGYRWKGRNIRSEFKHGTTCVILRRFGSMVLAPVSVSQNSNFSVEINAHGDTPILANFFGGQKYDGPQVKVKIKTDQFVKHKVEVKSPKFSPGIKMYLRIWIPSGSGSACIKSIRYHKIKSSINPVPPKPVPRKALPLSTDVKKKKRGIGIKPKEIYDMRFKPYENVKASDSSREMLVAQAKQVPLVSIITPTREGKELLEKCYVAINQNTAYPNWEWIIGDSDSKDDTADYIKGLQDPRIKLVERKTTEGSFSSINNELTKYAEGEYYLFLNNDTEPQLFWLYEMMSKIYNKEHIGAVGAKLMHGEKRIQHAGIMFTPSGPGNIGKPMLKVFGGAGFAARDRYFQAVTGACLLMRASDFEKINGFDPIYYFCYEDVDLCLKIKHDLGKKIIYAANAVLKHAESSTQKKIGTGGKLQKEGIRVFKERWMKKVEIDMPKFAANFKKDICNVDVSFVTCVNNIQQYSKYTVGSLFLNGTQRNYEILPILNINNRYSAAKALNMGIEKARGDVIVLCHQDVLFYRGWVDLLFKRIKEIGNDRWGVLGTAGITEGDKTVGAVYNLKGSMQWRQSAKGTVFPVQTVDEHCMVIRKKSGLKFDEVTFNGFHCYGPDICLTALSNRMKNYGILCPLVHDSGSGSLVSGRVEFMRLLRALSNKWGKKFTRIRTTTSLIKKGKIQTFIKF